MTTTARNTSRAWPGCGASLGFGDERLVEAPPGRCGSCPTITRSATSHMARDRPGGEAAGDGAGRMTKVFFANSGSEANDTVVKMVWYYNNALGRPAKKKIVVAPARLSRHHRGLGQPDRPARNHRDFDLPIASVLHTRLPAPLPLRQGRRERGGVRDAARPGAGGADLEGGGAEQVAAFIGEPVMGAGGVIVPPRTTTRRSRRCCASTTCC